MRRAAERRGLQMTRPRLAPSGEDQRIRAAHFGVPSAAGGATMRTMRLVEADEQHFTEGEPDIEPPEEGAISELDEVARLEEELDNEDVLEQDVEEGVPEETLEDLVHGADEDEDGDGSPESPVGLIVAGTDGVEAPDGARGRRGRGGTRPDPRAPAGPFDPGRGGRHRRRADRSLPAVAANSADEDEVRPCGTDEFTCRSCFLVQGRTLLADPATLVCRDCSA
jgi:hypothetical protein